MRNLLVAYCNRVSENLNREMWKALVKTFILCGGLEVTNQQNLSASIVNDNFIEFICP